MGFGEWMGRGIDPNEKIGREAVEGVANFGDMENVDEGEVGIEDVGGSGTVDADFLEEEVVLFDAFVVEEVVEVED